MIATALIDNTVIYLGCADEKAGNIIFKTSISTSYKRTVTDYSLIIQHVFELEHVDTACITGGIIASVVPQVTETILEAFRKLFRITPIEVGPGVKSGVDTKIDYPASLGTDMVVAAASAIAEYEPPMIIVNSCTNTTFSVIDDKKKFVGRVIAPGIRTAFDSVIQTSSLIGNFPIKIPEKVLGSTTEKAVQSGAIFGCVSSIEGLVARIQDELKITDPTVILTGESAPILAPHLRIKAVYDPNLMTKGLIRIYNKNCKSV